MLRRQAVIAQERQQQRTSRRGEEQPRRAPASLPALGLHALADPRLTHPANVARCREVLQAGQQAWGNQMVQRMARSSGPEVLQRQAPAQGQTARPGPILQDEDARQTRPLSLEEYLKDYVDYNITEVSYWLGPSSFVSRVPKMKDFWVHYQDGRRLKLSLDRVPARAGVSQTRGAIGTRIAIPEQVYIKRGGFIFPRIYNDVTTPMLIDFATVIRINQGLREKRREITELGVTFAFILAANVVPGEGGAGAAAGRRAGRLGRPTGGPRPAEARPAEVVLPVPVRLAPLQQMLRRLFRALGGERAGFQVRICDDATVLQSETAFSKVGIQAKYLGGAWTDVENRVVWVHEEVVRLGGLIRKWGARLNLKQLLAHEIGHARGASLCSHASRVGAELPGLTQAERVGLLNDAVHIARKEGVPLPALRLPRGYVPPPPAR